MRHLPGRCLRRMLPMVFAAIAGAWAAGPAPAAAPPATAPSASAPDEVLLFSFFRKNGEDGVYLAFSEDGLEFRELNGGRPVTKGTVGGKLTRDPCIARGPDGVFHMTWTPGWYEKGGGIGLAHSKDLLTWSEQQLVQVMKHEPAARNAWAPELFFDEASGRWLIFWATTIPGRFPATDAGGDGGLNHRMYFTATKDFKEFEETRLFYDGGFNVIDATLVRDGAADDGRRFVMVLKDETKTPVRKNLRLAFAGKAEGPYGPASEPFSVDWVEGPTAAKVGGHWVVYYDEYTRGRYGAVRTKDWKTWETVTDKLRFPKGARHGTVLRVGREVAEKLGAPRREAVRP